MTRLFIFTIVVLSSFSNLKAQSNVDSTAAVDQYKLLSQEIDSLKIELYKYKLNESYFNTALSDQATRFSLIVAGLLGLAGLFAWGGYRYEVERIRKEFKENFKQQSDEFENFKKDASDLGKDLTVTMARLYTIIADYYETLPGVSIGWRISAVKKWFYLVNNDKKERESAIKAISSNLKRAMEQINEIVKDTEHQERFKGKERQIILNDLSEISKIDDEEIRNLCAEIRLAINNYVKSENENDNDNVEAT